MIEPKYFFEILKENNINFFAGVPDSLLKDFCAYVSDNADKKNHFIAANEGNALSLGIGHYLSTSNLPLIYMQNSGLGNIINPMLSLADSDVYSIPMILLIGWRGEKGIKDEPQHKKQGRITEELLKIMEVPYEIIGPDSDPEVTKYLLKDLIALSKIKKNPCAILVKQNTFDDYKLKKNKIYKKPLFREEAIEQILKQITLNEILISTTGVTSRELFELRKNNNSGHEKDFLTVGGMGHASQIALGIALEKKHRDVFCLDGDGAFLMHMGSIAINGSSNCKNFKHIVFNNSAHDSVGAQPTVADELDILKIASSCGYKWTKRTQSLKDLNKKLNELKSIDGPALLEIQVRSGFRKNLGRPTNSPEKNKNLFMNFLKN